MKHFDAEQKSKKGTSYIFRAGELPNAINDIVQEGNTTFDNIIAGAEAVFYMKLSDHYIREDATFQGFSVAKTTGIDSDEIHLRKGESTVEIIKLLNLRRIFKS